MLLGVRFQQQGSLRSRGCNPSDGLHCSSVEVPQVLHCATHEGNWFQLPTNTRQLTGPLRPPTSPVPPPSYLDPRLLQVCLQLDVVGLEMVKAARVQEAARV